MPTKKPVTTTKPEGESKKENPEENKEKAELQPEQKDQEHPTENKEGETATEEKKNLIDEEAFKKLSPEEQKDILDKRVASRKIRCKNWPNCKDPNCIYAHPTETVSLIKYLIILFILINLVPSFSRLFVRR